MESIKWTPGGKNVISNNANKTERKAQSIEMREFSFIKCNTGRETGIEKEI